MDHPYRTKPRNLFRLWTEHDLAGHGPEFGGYRPAFYDSFRQEDEPEVWRFIEAYLRKHKSFAARNGGAVEPVVTVFVTDLTR
jgi:hypothetical protein